MQVIVLGSDCVVTKKYLELVKRRMKALRRKDFVVSSTDGEVHRKYGIQNRCDPSMCPGCGFLFPMNGEYLPALVVDGVVELHSLFPSEEELDQVLL